jgi:hypothetical protein
MGRPIRRTKPSGETPGQTMRSSQARTQSTSIFAPTKDAELPSKAGTQLLDCLFLAVIVAISVAPYVWRLGFYSDDWAFLGSLNSFGDFSNAGRSTVFDFQELIGQRPTQAAYSWLLFRFFHLDPLGYHVTNTIVIAAMTALLYLTLRELRVARPIAFSIAAVYALLPNYSTDRFWFAAFGYPLSMTMYFLSLFANLRSLRSPTATRWAWKGVALTALIIGGLGYEVVVPLFVANILLLWYLARKPSFVGRTTAVTGRRLVVFLAPDLAALSAVVAYKIAFAAQSGVPANYPKYVLWLGAGALVTNLGSYGVALPKAVSWSLASIAWPAIGTSIAIGVATFGFVLRIARRSNVSSVVLKGWAKLAVIGIATFFLGYSIFLESGRILFTSTGINNRVSIAGSLGFAILVVATFGFVARSLGRRPSWRPAILALLVGAFCFSASIVNIALADNWGQAWEEQRAILADIRDNLPPPEAGSAVILDGVCPYVGPAVVFESNWDLAGALEIEYADPTIRADVTSANLEVGASGLSTTLYGDHVAHYPYGDSLILYDARTSRAWRLRDEQTARIHLGESVNECPKGAAGWGVPIFGVDVWFHDLELKYFWR